MVFNRKRGEEEEEAGLKRKRKWKTVEEKTRKASCIYKNNDSALKN